MGMLTHAGDGGPVRIDLAARRWLYYLVCCVALVSVSGSTGARAAGTNLLATLSDVAILKSRPPRFVVVSTNRVWNAYLMRWMEVVSDKISDITGLEMPFEGRALRVVVPISPAEGTDDLAWSENFVGGEFVQELTIRDFNRVDVGRADVALSRLLLNGYVVYRWVRNAEESPGSRAVEAPLWLAVGIAQNFYPEDKARNAATVMERWERGAAPTVRQFLAPPEENSAAQFPDRAVCGLFAAWLGSLPDSPGIFDALFNRSAEHGWFSADAMVEAMDDCDSVTELEKKWDQWILRQKRFVYMPGVVTAPILKRFKEELVVYRTGVNDETGSSGLFSVTMDELIERRKEKWVQAVVRNRITRLRFLFMGRGSEMDAVIDAYCGFLDALAKGTRTRRLRSLLAKAQGTLEALETGLNAERSETRTPGTD